MPFAKNGEAKIYYEVSGSGFPILMLAAGFMYSRIEAWSRMQEMYPDHRFNPLTDYTSDFRMVAMDQRNANGQSVAPIKPTDDWSDFADDQMAVLEAAGIDRFHIWGGCIGVSFAFELCKRVPERIASMVLQDPVGVSLDAPMATIELFDKYAADITADRPDLDIEDVRKFGRNLFDKDFDKEFTFNATRQFIRGLDIPMLVMLKFDDAYHPRVTADEIHANAQDSEFYDDWTSATAERNANRIRNFLNRHTP